MIWSTPDLTPSAVPQLSEDEKIIVSVGNVGLYNGDTKSLDHSKGTIFLTSQRLIYVDGADPILHSVQVGTHQIGETSYSPRFLKSSAKISLVLLPQENDHTKTLKRNLKNSWICSICSFSNPSTAWKCETCGVEAQEDTAVYITPAAIELSPGECPQCTFINHPSVLFCEMCGSSIKLESSQASPTLGSHIKISFRSGKSHSLWDALQASTSTRKPANIDNSRETENTGNEETSGDGRMKHIDPNSSNLKASSSNQKSSFGIRTLQARNQQMQSKFNTILDQALKSPSDFKAVRSEVAAIADRLNLGNTDPRAVFKLPTVIGIDANQSEGLARQLVDLLIGKDDLLVHAGGMLTLHDTYSLFNRCRGIKTVSPQQLLNALKQCEPLDLPLRVRTLGSGLKIVESRGGLDQALQRLVHWITTESQELSWREGCGFSARDVSDKFGCSMQIALEELSLGEERGKLCRDEHTSGLRFFPNLFLMNKKDI